MGAGGANCELGPARQSFVRGRPVPATHPPPHGARAAFPPSTRDVLGGRRETGLKVQRGTGVGQPAPHFPIGQHRAGGAALPAGRPGASKGLGQSTRNRTPGTGRCRLARSLVRLPARVHLNGQMGRHPSQGHAISWARDAQPASAGFKAVSSGAQSEGGTVGLGGEAWLIPTCAQALPHSTPCPPVPC